MTNIPGSDEKSHTFSTIAYYYFLIMRSLHGFFFSLIFLIRACFCRRLDDFKKPVLLRKAGHNTEIPANTEKLTKPSRGEWLTGADLSFS